MKRKIKHLTLLSFLVILQVFSQNNNSHKDISSEERERYLKKIEKTVEEAKREVLEENLTTVFGTRGDIVSHGIDFDTYDGGRYKEAAEEENWNKHWFPYEMERQYQRYLKKKEKERNRNIIIGVISTLLIVSFIILLNYREKKVKANPYDIMYKYFINHLGNLLFESKEKITDKISDYHFVYKKDNSKIFVNNFSLKFKMNKVYIEYKKKTTECEINYKHSYPIAKLNEDEQKLLALDFLKNIPKE